MPEMYRPVHSETFAVTLRDFDQVRQADIEKAIKRVLVNPLLPAYQRTYLTPYRQEHPTDKQITIFFEVDAARQLVFFVWVNDDDHLHDTRKNHGDDPCVKEFDRLRQAGDLEVYDQDRHEGKFSSKPRHPSGSAPIYLSFEKYDTSVFMHALDDGNGTYYSVGAGTDAAYENQIHDHYKHLLEGTRAYFLALKRPFELRPLDQTFHDIIRTNIVAGHWQYRLDQGEHIYSTL
jgi:hypothetical protein